jgi:hypothetical protein
MFDYSEIAAVAEEMIAEFGALIVLTRDVNAEYNVATAMVEGTERRWTGIAVRVEYALRDIDGDAIQMNDARLLIGVSGMEQPKPGDRVLYAGERLTVINCKPIKPATVAVAYDVQARR